MDNVQGLIKEVAGELSQLMANKKERTSQDDRRIQDVFRNKLLPFLKPAMESLGEKDTSILIKFLTILREKGRKLSVQLVVDLFYTLFPLLTSVRFPSCFDQAVELCVGLSQDMALQGWAMTLTSTLGDILPSLAEISLRLCPDKSYTHDPFCIKFVQPAHTNPALASCVVPVASASQHRQLVLCSVKCAAAASRRMHSSPAHARLAGFSVLLFRLHAGCAAVREACLACLADVVPRLPKVPAGLPLGGAAPAAAQVAALMLQLLALSDVPAAGSYVLATQVEGAATPAAAPAPVEELQAAAAVLRACLERDAAAASSGADADTVQLLLRAIALFFGSSGDGSTGGGSGGSGGGGGVRSLAGPEFNEVRDVLLTSFDTFAPLISFDAPAIQELLLDLFFSGSCHPRIRAAALKVLAAALARYYTLLNPAVDSGPGSASASSTVAPTADGAAAGSSNAPSLKRALSPPHPTSHLPLLSPATSASDLLDVVPPTPKKRRGGGAADCNRIVIDVDTDDADGCGPADTGLQLLSELFFFKRNSGAAGAKHEAAAAAAARDRQRVFLDGFVAMTPLLREVARRCSGSDFLSAAHLTSLFLAYLDTPVLREAQQPQPQTCVFPVLRDWIGTSFVDFGAKLARSPASENHLLSKLPPSAVLAAVEAFHSLHAARSLLCRRERLPDVAVFLCDFARLVVRRVCTVSTPAPEAAAVLDAALAQLNASVRLDAGARAPSLNAAAAADVYVEALHAPDAVFFEVSDVVFARLLAFVQAAALPASARAALAKALAESLNVRRAGGSEARRRAVLQRTPELLLALYSARPEAEPSSSLERQGSASPRRAAAHAQLLSVGSSASSCGGGGGGGADAPALGFVPYYNRYHPSSGAPLPPLAATPGKRGRQASSPPPPLAEGFFDFDVWLRVLGEGGLLPPLAQVLNVEATAASEASARLAADVLSVLAAMITLSGDEIHAPGSADVIRLVYHFGVGPYYHGLLDSPSERVQCAARDVMCSLIKRDAEDDKRIRLSADPSGEPTPAAATARTGSGTADGPFLTLLQVVQLPPATLASLTEAAGSGPPAAKRAARGGAAPATPPVALQSGLHLLLQHLRVLERKEGGALTDVVVMVVAAVARTVVVEDSGVGLVVEILLHLLRLDPRGGSAPAGGGGSAAGGGSIATVIARQELRSMETRFNLGLHAMLRQHPHLFALLLSELDDYNNNRIPAAGSLLVVVADHIDCDVETFVADNVSMLISYVIRTPEVGEPQARISGIVKCILELGAERLEKQYGVRVHAEQGEALMVQMLISELIVVNLDTLLAAIFLDTRTRAEGYASDLLPISGAAQPNLCDGPAWCEYFERVAAQLGFLQKAMHEGGDIVAKVFGVSAKVQRLTREIVEYPGTCPVFALGLQRVKRALMMLHLCYQASDKYYGGSTTSPFPQHPDAESHKGRLLGVAAQIDGSIFHTLDHVGDLLTGVAAQPPDADGEGGVAERAAAAAVARQEVMHKNLCKGLKVLRALILLLGENAVKYANKFTPSLNFEFLGLGSRFGGNERDKREVVTLLGDTWVSYIMNLSEETIVQFLDAFVVEAVSLKEVSEPQALRLLSLLFAKTKESARKWAAVTHFLPLSSPRFSLLVAEIKQHVGHARGAAEEKSKRESLVECLSEIHEGMRSYSKECRNVSLNSLIDYCTTNWQDVLELLAEKEMPDIVLRIVQTLLKMSREWTTDSRMHSKVLTSLGLFGALDPNSMKSVRSSTDSSLEDLSDDEFAIRLINDFLLKTLQLPWSTGRSQAHDKAAYAIQELFKFLKERSAAKGAQRSTRDRAGMPPESKYPWWGKISEEGRSILVPYLETHYKIVVTVPRNAQEVEYVHGMLFRTWLRAWILNMISKAQGYRGQMIMKVRNIVKDDIDIALFILPYLVLNVCVHGGDDVAALIAREINTVLGYADSHPGSASEHVQVICTLLDKLSAWRNEATSRTPDTTKFGENMGKARHISSLLEKLARACRVTNPMRALFYTEMHLRGVRESTQSLKRQPTMGMTQLSQVGVRSWCDPKDLRLCQEVYSRLREPDGLLGVQCMRQQNQFQEDLEEQAVDFETVGMWSDAMQRYELLIEKDPDSLQHQEHMIECMKSLGQYAVMTAYVETRPHLKKYAAQAAWRLGEWTLAEESLPDVKAALAKEPSQGPVSFEDGVAMALVAMKKNDMAAVVRVTARARDTIHSELAAACLESYDTAYKYVVKLHALTDIERAVRVADKNSHVKEAFLHDLSRHTALTEITPETRDVLLSVRRALSSILGCHRHASSTWLEIGKLCRKAGMFQVAEGALLRAERMNACVTDRPEGLVIEQARLLHAQGNIHGALRLVMNPDPKIQEYEGDLAAARAKLRLKSIHWAADMNHLPAKEVIHEFQQIASQKPSEAVFLSLAKFMEKMLADIKEQISSRKDVAIAAKKLPLRNVPEPTKLEELIANVGDTVPQIIVAYVKSLQYGTKHLYHALPRLISTYIMEITALQNMANEDECPRLSVAMDALHKQMTGALILSAPVLYTSLNTLIPLLTHKVVKVGEILSPFVRKILVTYPERAAWSLMAFHHSKVNNMERKNVLLNKVEKPLEREYTKKKKTSAGPALKKALTALAEAKTTTLTINKLAEMKTQKVKVVKVTRQTFFESLAEMLPLTLVCPTQSQLALTLPNGPVSNDLESPTSLFTHNETIVSVCPEALVMTSLQAPKKLTVVVSTGHERSFLCKAMDELRKDLRIMELCHVMNLLLKKNPETRQRELYTRTFSITLTGDASGMIEWVNNVVPLRSLLDNLYARSGQGMGTGAIKGLHEKTLAKQLAPAKMYQDILATYPPAFNKWFAEKFPDPTSWFRARGCFTKGCAVWSMIGHTVGLGDRHAENVLIDTETGDVVHVDFSILFDKGLSLAVPEVVRFRLTPNVVDGFGISGVEGVFRRCSEVTMGVMRHNRATVMSVLEHFIHDPCMEKTEGWELPNCQRRLDGYFDEPSDIVLRKTKRVTGGLQLGIKGQVQKLIANATSPESLSVMWVWWMPWY